MASSNYISPLRYPGGKAKLAPYIKSILSSNRLLDCHYVEPYAGGAGVALELLVQDYATHIHINDISLPIFAFWSAAFYHSDDLCTLIQETPVTIDTWVEQREIQANLSSHDILEIGFSTFFLNRTNRSGILTGGVIGGKSQEGVWKLDARYNKDELISRIKLVARHKHKVTLYQEDAEDFLSLIQDNLPKKNFTFFDPPYFVKGQDLYENHYNEDDHARLANHITQQYDSQNWVISYDHQLQICALYENFAQMTYQLNYSAAQVCKGAEVMIFSHGLNIPENSPFITKVTNE